MNNSHSIEVFLMRKKNFSRDKKKIDMWRINIF